jgi:Tol biopolymer transport system component
MRDQPPSEKLTAEQKKLLDADPAYFGELYIMNADGTEQTRLTDWPGYDGGPFFSPDGARIVWRHFEPGGRIADIYTMKTDGSDRRRLTTFGCMSWAPYYHPSGRYVIFASNKLGFRNFELFLVDIEGAKEPVRVTGAAGFDGLPVFSPDGGRLCWTSTRHDPKSRKGQLFMAKWDHDAALTALESAPPRKTHKPHAPHGHGHPGGHGKHKNGKTHPSSGT